MLSVLLAAVEGLVVTCSLCCNEVPTAGRVAQGGSLFLPFFSSSVSWGAGLHVPSSTGRFFCVRRDCSLDAASLTPTSKLRSTSIRLVSWRHVFKHARPMHCRNTLNTLQSMLHSSNCTAPRLMGATFFLAVRGLRGRCRLGLLPLLAVATAAESSTSVPTRATARHHACTVGW